MIDPRTAGVLKQAVGAAQSGDTVRARHLAERALADGGDAVALNAFLGMLSARANDLEAAARHLEAARRGRPADATIACNLIAVLIDKGDPEAALGVATRDLAFADSSLRVARYRGFVAQSLERFDDAVEAYEHVVRHVPDDFESWNNLGNARSATGDLDGSVAALERAMALNPDAPPTRLNLAVALRSAGRSGEAEDLLRRSAGDFPEDGRALHELYVQYKKEGRNAEALEALEGAVARDPDDAGLQLKLGVEYGLVERSDAAEAAFRRAIALDGTLEDAYLGLAAHYEHDNREDAFAPLIEQAERHGVDPGAIAYIRALENRRRKRFDEALANLAQVPERLQTEPVVHLRGMVLDRLGRTDEAFEAFEAVNGMHERAPGTPLERAAEYRDELSAELAFMQPDWAARWPAPERLDDRRDPIFLVGFPRSGTTLLDTILMGHPDTVVLEEEPPLTRVEKRIGGLAAAPSLDARALSDARDHYFDEVAKIDARSRDGTKRLIDKSPLFMSKAALIHRLFPDARFILALRHPCDVLLSCFMSNFRLNRGTSNFLRLEDAARFYDLNFRYWERARALFPLKVHTIVYERLVEDVEGEVRPLFNALGLDWHAAALDHRATARARGLITTASYSQVIEPIYTRAAGRWRRYRHHLEPILPTLAPWIEKFGYTL